MSTISAAEQTRRSLWTELNPQGPCKVCGHDREKHHISTDRPHEFIQMSEEQAEAMAQKAMDSIYYGLDQDGALAYLKRRNLSQIPVVFSTLCRECGPDEDGSYHACYSRGHTGLTP